MRRLTKIGQLPRRNATQIPHSRLGIGFEKLDRALFDPKKAYDKLAALGVKWIRIQSGWKRTEQVKGVYDFGWLDDIVDNLIARGMHPWVNLAWGNDLYTRFAEQYFGAVGCPPTDTEEERLAWSNYCAKLTEHFSGRVEYYEVWNEPDLSYAWRHENTVQGTKGTPNATEYAEFVKRTSIALKQGNPNAKVVAFAIARPKDSISFVSQAFKAGIAPYIDAASYHLYTTDSQSRAHYAACFINTVHHYAPGLPIIQGESGAQSRYSEAGALREMNWDEQKQTKFLLRQVITDLSADLLFTSYFSTVDMAEALNGLNAQQHSFHDYGYFGVLAAEFNNDGIASGEYHEKPSYYALQHMASLFAEEVTPVQIPLICKPTQCRYINAPESTHQQISTFAFRLADGKTALAYWYNSNLLEASVSSTISMEILCPHSPQLIDPMDGNIYSLPDDMTEHNGSALLLKHLPLKDYPMILSY